ncbi:DUF402 domain-containing protein [Flexivirga lutea]
MTSPTASDPSGTRVHADYRKWDGSPHWQSHGTLLGVDVHGCWVGFPRGTHFERPGAAFDLERDSVSLFPAATGFTPAFNEPTGSPELVQVYVDITTAPVWSRTDDGGWRVTMIDLDLDVVQRANGFLYVDDEDEFLDHQRRFGYPEEVVRRAEDDTRRVFGAIRDGRGPFDDTGWRWMRRLHPGTTDGTSYGQDADGTESVVGIE